MMSTDFEVDFIEHLKVSSPVTEIAGERVFPDIIPEKGQVPCLTYKVIEGTLGNSLDGYTSGLANYIVQVDCWAMKYELARRLGLAVRDRFGVAAATFSVVVRSAPAETMFEPDTKRYRRMLTVSCWHKENLVV